MNKVPRVDLEACTRCWKIQASLYRISHEQLGTGMKWTMERSSWYAWIEMPSPISNPWLKSWGLKNNWLKAMASCNWANFFWLDWNTNLSSSFHIKQQTVCKTMRLISFLARNTIISRDAIMNALVSRSDFLQFGHFQNICNADWKWPPF